MQHLTLSPQIIGIINQIFDMEKKLERIPEAKSLQRNIRRIKSQLEAMDIEYHNPLGERYDETRTDCEATISGSSNRNLVITEVIKPLVTTKMGNFQQIIQKAVVIVEGV